MKVGVGRMKVAVVVTAALGLLGAGVIPAVASRGGAGTVKHIAGLAKAQAFALDAKVEALGAIPVDVAPISELSLVGNAGPKFDNALKAEVPGLLEALVLATSAETRSPKDLLARASARVATVKLHLLGDLLVKVLKSGCEVTPHQVTLGSEVVFANGSVLGIAIDNLALATSPNARLAIPGVGTLILNEQRVERESGAHGGRLNVTVNALHLELDGLLGFGDVTVAHSSCSLSGDQVAKDVQVVENVNGHQTKSMKDSDDQGAPDGDGSADDRSGDRDHGGLLGLNHLLGGNLLGGGVL